MIAAQLCAAIISRPHKRRILYLKFRSKKLPHTFFVRRDALAEWRDPRRIEKCKQGSVGSNHEQHIAMESCTAPFVGILAAGSNSI
jgi:hypothetical protein